MNQYEPVIGLEIHAELSTFSKLFCRCPNLSNELNSPPNTAICPTCLGLPGALPVLNQKAVESTAQLGESLGCEIAKITKWDRKNYFYPDLPKGYQISQYDQPICRNGTLTWFDAKDGSSREVALTRIHLEEDTGKLTHPEGKDYSLIDYNRSSIPLLELVTEPVIASASEAKQFGEEYQRHLRELGIAEANMEKGQMRCEANISVIPAELNQDHDKRLSGTKVEVKNLNSFRSLERAIIYEINRQSEVLAGGGTVRQETRGWNESKGETYVMRTKESADDYRYFPEPDLGPLVLGNVVDESEKKFSRADLSNLLREYNLASKEIAISMNDPKRLTFWEQLVLVELPTSAYALALQWINQEPTILQFTPEEVKAALSGLQSKQYSAAVFKEAILSAASGELEQKLSSLAKDQQVDNLDAVVDQIIVQHPKEVEEFRGGKQQLFGFFVGQVRRSLDGKGDPTAIADALKKQLQ